VSFQSCSPWDAVVGGEEERVADARQSRGRRAAERGEVGDQCRLRIEAGAAPQLLSVRTVVGGEEDRTITLVRSVGRSLCFGLTSATSDVVQLGAFAPPQLRAMAPVIGTEEEARRPRSRDSSETIRRSG